MADANPMDNLKEKLKTGLNDEDKKLLDKLTADAEAFAKVTDSDGDGKSDMAGVKAFFMKDGSFSKTSAILVAAWFTGLGMWIVQSLFHGMTLPVIGVVIPAFDSSAALTMLGAASSLYLTVHNVKVNIGGSQPSAAEKAGG